MLKLVQWKHAPKEAMIFDVVLSGVPKKDQPDVTNEKMVSTFLEKAPFKTDKVKGEMKSYLRYYLSCFPSKDKAGEARLYTFLAFLKKETKSMQNHAKAVVGKMVRFAYDQSYDVPTRTHELPATDEVSLKFGSMNTSDIVKLMPSVDVGRDKFSSVKLLLYRHLLEIPDDQCGTIEVGNQMKQNPKERKKLEASMRKFLKREGGNWEVRWNPIDKIFIVARIKDWQKGDKN